MSADTGVCWCASDSRCPHRIVDKIPTLWNEMEKAIDDQLGQFDRRSIKKFLKRAPDGSERPTTSSDNFRDKYGSELQAIVSKSASGDPHEVRKQGKGVVHPLSMNNMRPGTAPEGPTPIHDKAGGGGDKKKKRKPLDPGMTKPLELAEGEFVGSLQTNKQGYARRPHTTQASATNLSRSMPTLPSIPGAERLPDGSLDIGESAFRSTDKLDLEVAWGEAPAQTQPPSSAPSGGISGGVSHIQPGESALAMGLMRIADVLSRKVLPWQASSCPRAVEQLRDLRSAQIQQKHKVFVDRMKKQLEDKVLQFLSKKDEEVDFWMQKEVRVWMDAMSKQEADQTSFFQADLKRIAMRQSQQDVACKQRELGLAHALDDKERDNTRDQLVRFRRLCRSEDKMANVDTRALHASFEAAEGRVAANETVNTREVAKRQETAHDWLCCLADNALIAAESETVLAGMFSTLDQEKERAIISLHSAMDAYTKQHNAILDAILAFSKRIHTHASDYLRREQLVSRAFLQYLLSIISGELKPHTSEVRRSSVAWEGKFVSDRAHKRDQAANKEYNLTLMPFDKLVAELRDRMVRQYEHVTVKMQSVLNGRENDINKRKATIHSKLAKHVNKACNSRRQRLKTAAGSAKDESALEEKALLSINELSGDLRTAVDQIWVKEHLRERRMYEAAGGRMARLEKSALIIWKKHSHLAISQKEDYEDWLNMYRKDRDMNSAERRTEIQRDWIDWRDAYGALCIKYSKSCRPMFNSFLNNVIDYNPHESPEDNLKALNFKTGTIKTRFKSICDYLRRVSTDNVTSEVAKANSYLDERRQLLINEWQDNLFRLNDSINRRVSTLKDMEGDLEETLRLTLAQHEVEACMFEQSSCARLENFWLNSRNKLNILGRELKEAQADLVIQRQSGSKAGKKSANDRQIDDILALPPVDATSGKKTGSAKELAGEGVDDDAVPEEEEVSNAPFVDTFRIKRLLDDVRTEHYRNFNHRMVKSLEIVKKESGQGRKRHVPAFLVTKTLFHYISEWWDQSKMTEKAVGRLMFKGKVLFKNGLPKHAQTLFVISSTLACMSEFTLKGQHHLIDCDEILEYIEKFTKRMFLIGFLMIAIELNSFGENLLKTECVWACTSCSIIPPAELLGALQTKGKSGNTKSSPTKPKDPTGSPSNYYADLLEPEGADGFFVEDPVDIFNSIYTLSEVDKNNRKAEQDEKFSKMSDVRRTFDSQTMLPLEAIYASISSVFPAVDLTIMACLLGRPDGQFETSPYRFCQAIIMWRRVSLAIVMAVKDAPGAEYARLTDLLSTHTIERAGKRKAGYSSIACVSPFEAVAAVLDWITSIHGVPISVLQAFALFTRGGSVDPWLEDPKQSCRGDRFSYELDEFMQVIQYCKDYESEETNFQAVFPPDLMERLEKLDVQNNHEAPLELLRSYIRKEDPDVSNTQITAVFWSISRGRGMEADMIKLSQITQAERLAEEQERLQAEIALLREKEDEQNEADALIQGMLSADDVLPERGEVDLVLGGDFDEGSHYGDRDEPGSPGADGGSQFGLERYDHGGKPRPVETVFKGDSAAYMKRFEHDVTAYLSAAPSLDTNVTCGLFSAPLAPAAAHEILTDAMQLDPSARNHVPGSACLWMGVRVIPAEEGLTSVSIDPAIEKSQSKGIFLGIRDLASEPVLDEATGVDLMTPHQKQLRRLFELRMKIEMDMVMRFPQLCEQRNSDVHYGAAGGAPLSHQNHWSEVFDRRLSRIDKLTCAWRDTMMTEWASSLYLSRQKRYMERSQIIRDCISVYHNQYDALKDSVVKERGELLTKYSQLDLELHDIVREDATFFSYHGSFIERIIRNLEGQMDRALHIFQHGMKQFLLHCGAVKRRGLARVFAAENRLKEDMERSCTGLIVGYTGGFAQGHFDELMYRGEVWRKNVTEMHGNVIIEKEKFVHVKEETERDLALQIADRITLDRARTKGLLDGLTEDSASLQEVVSTARGSYATIQKDANARLVIRIEKAVRESRKLRSAAEEEPELETAVLREIRIILDNAKTSCDSIVKGITESSEQQLENIEPLRNPHREKMLDKVETLKKGWDDVEELLIPLVNSFKNTMTTHLNVLAANCTEGIGEYRETETSALNREFSKERRALIASFREHFTGFDLSEDMIFERFNYEVKDTVLEMKSMWGASKPAFIAQTINDIDNIAKEAVARACNDVRTTAYDHASCSDESTLSRMELADVLTHTLCDLVETSNDIFQKFDEEKEKTISSVEGLSMNQSGDMVRPQVTAVLDLLCAGIEIDTDFTKGYDSLVEATHAKSDDAMTELDDFISRFSGEERPGSLPMAIKSLNDRIVRRKTEVMAVIEAAEAHMVADNSRMDVVLQAGKKDIYEWTSLTNQLIENAFYNAEENYLSPLFPEPTESPREDVLPPDEDRVAKIKDMLRKTHDPADFDHAQDLEKLERRRAARSRTNNVAIAPVSAPPAELQLKKPGKPNETKELQEGWLECYTDEGYTYYFNPASGESLWDLPGALKVPIYGDDDVRIIETPREMVTGEFYEQKEIVQEPTIPNLGHDVSSIHLRDKRIVMSEVAEIARSMGFGSTDTAVDVTSVLRGMKRERAPKPILPTTPAGIDKYDNNTGNTGFPDSPTNQTQNDGYSAFEQSTIQSSHGNETVIEENNLPDVTELDQPFNTYSSVPKQSTEYVTGKRVMNENVNVNVNDNTTRRELEAYNDGTQSHSQDATAIALQEGLFNDALGDEGSYNGDQENYNDEPSKAGEPAYSDETGYEVPVQPQQELMLDLSLGVQDEMTIETDEQIAWKKTLAEDSYKEARERDLLLVEDKRSAGVEFEAEDERKNTFQLFLKSIISGKGVIKEQVEELKRMSRGLKRITLIEQFVDNSISWDKLEQRVLETLAAEEEAAALAERLKTEMGRDRQRKILEHAEDIDEMVDFFRNKCGLGRTAARKVATECVLRKITTSKKMAKIWSRNEMDLLELGLDEDDAEEVAGALREISMSGTGFNQSLNNTQGSFAQESMATNNNANSFYTQQSGQQQVFNQSQGSSEYKATDNSQYYDPNTVATTGENQDPSAYDENFGYEDPNGGYYDENGQWIDPSAVDENAGYVDPHANADAVTDEYATDPNYRALTQAHIDNGWTEAYTDEGYLYYYNSYTAESLWEYPEDVAAPAPAPQYQQPTTTTSSTDASAGKFINRKEREAMKAELKTPGYKYVRSLPIPILPEVSAYSRDEGIVRQLSLLTVQDRWQNLLVKTQFYLTEQRALFNKSREEMFDKVTGRLESRLGVFVDDIKYMQRTLKKEMGDLNASERDLRRLFDEENPNVIMAEKLSFILSGLEKLKTKAGARYESAAKQIDKFGADWQIIESELLQVGNIYEESLEANLEQCRLACEHNSKVFAYDQAQSVTDIKQKELKALRSSVRQLLMLGADSSQEAENARNETRSKQRKQLNERAIKKAQLDIDLANYPDSIESELMELDLEDIPRDELKRDETEILMSFMITQVEMESALAVDYDSISEATKKIANDLQEDILSFDTKEKYNVNPKGGSNYNKHRDTISRHGSALRVTLNKVRGKVKEGYQMLNSRIEALDFDVERSAEEELADEAQD
jgi:hypothetical protein